MATSMKGIGRMTKQRGLVHTKDKTAPAMRASSIWTSSMARELKSGQMVRATRATISKARSTDEVASPGWMAALMKVNSSATTLRARVSTAGQTAEFTWASG